MGGAILFEFFMELRFVWCVCSSLTLEGVRRLLEKDMGLKKCDLDVHKRFIKKCLEEVIFVKLIFV